MRRGSKPRGDWILTLNVPHCLPKPSLLILRWTVCCTEEQQASARSYVQPIPSSRLQNAVQVNSSHVQRSEPVSNASVEHLSKCKRTWPIFLLLLSPLLFINWSLFNPEPVFIQNVQRHINLAFAGLVRLIPELVFREICN